MKDGDLEKLEYDVWLYVETLRNSPQARMKSREIFYKKYGQEDDSKVYGFGDAEIAFLTWEDRAVIRPTDGRPPGSAWWSSVNLWFIYLSELAGKAFEIGFPPEKLPVPTQFWFEFIKVPNSVNWYRAHNSSIIDGYLKYPDLAALETVPEKIFINMVLYRLLFAQSLEEGQDSFPKLSKILGDPRGNSVQFITGLDPYYPDHYPMNEQEINEVLGKTHSLAEFTVKFLDDVLIEPELTYLYNAASIWNKQPDIVTMIKDHKPAYPYGKILPDTDKSTLINILIWFRQLFARMHKKFTHQT